MNALYWFCVGATAVAAGAIMLLAYLEFPTRAERDRDARKHAQTEDTIPSRLDALDGLPIDPRRWRS